MTGAWNTDEHSPLLPPWATADLTAYACDWAERGPAYATPLTEIIAFAGDRDWLEGAVLAGYVPHIEGVELALRGIHFFCLAQIEECSAEGVDGDAINWTRWADAYRRLISILERQVAELEHRREELFREPPSDETDVPASLRSIWADERDRAARRRERALARAASAEADNADSLETRGNNDTAGGGGDQ
jgi:hypothetical protein